MRKKILSRLQYKIRRYYKALNLREAAKLSFQIWYDIAQLSNLALDKVEIKEFNESFKEYLEIYGIGKEAMEEFEVGENVISISDKKTGYVIFVDFTRSTEYFIEFEENYTGPIIFYSYNMVLREYLKHSGGEFLENTGDGAFIFTENLSVKDILAMLYLAEVIRSEAERAGLLVMEENISPVHIGISYGKGYMIEWNMEKKFISPATWEAAKNCKEAPRIYSPYNLFKIYPDIFAQNVKIKTGIIDNNLKIKISFIVKKFDIFDYPIERELSELPWLELPVKTSVEIL